MCPYIYIYGQTLTKTTNRQKKLGKYVDIIIKETGKSNERTNSSSKNEKTDK